MTGDATSTELLRRGTEALASADWESARELFRHALELTLAREAPVPTLLVRHGLRPGGLAPAETMTRFTWTLAS
jgi:hypothetical protein